MKTNRNIRSITAYLVMQVLDHGKSLRTLLPSFKTVLNKKDSALLQELCFGIMRFLPQLEWILFQLVKKPLINKKRLAHYLLISGLYQLIYTRIPTYAVLAETVEGVVEFKLPHLKKLINGVLRQFQRQKIILLDKFSKSDIYHLHPSWLKKRILTAWPLQYSKIINTNNKKPPMWLRVNRRYYNRDAYLTLLLNNKISAVSNVYLPDAIRLEKPINVKYLPGFDFGWVSVQDISSQKCVLLLAPQNGEDILDLCAAPGNKTAYLLEIAPNAQVIAIDIDRHRTKLIYDNLSRLKLQAKIITGDGCTLKDCCGDKLFDRILLDAPCSATGIIRRHPEIKWLRQEKDIYCLIKLQSRLLDAAWKKLKSSGILLYSTCSILPEENSHQIINFLSKYPNAHLHGTGNNITPGLQYLPLSPDLGDGFFYAKIIKKK